MKKLLTLYWKKLNEIISNENKFFKDNPHLKSFRTKLIATIIVVFYTGVLALVAKGVSALLSLLNIPYSNFIAVGITLIFFVLITTQDIRKNPINKKGAKMNKKAWFGFDPRLEILILAIIFFFLLLKLGIIKLG